MGAHQPILTPEAAAKDNVQHCQSCVQEERVVGRLAFRVDAREYRREEVVPSGCEDEASGWMSVRNTEIVN